MERKSQRRITKVERITKGETETMNENLSEMVKGQQEANPAMFSETDLDLPTEETQSQSETVAETRQLVSITSLSSWFEANASQFDNINQVKVAIRGVDSTKTLIMAVKDDAAEADSDGNQPRNLRVFENADNHPVLNLPAESMQVYNNGFRIIYRYGDNIAIKCYGIRTGLIAVFCNNINGLIPYAITRVKRKDTEIEILTKDPNEVTQKLAQILDKETLQLRYKQVAKSIDELTTNQDAITWLLERQAEITDINHHLQIDNIIIDTLS
jgi:hypothetical protein